MKTQDQQRQYSRHLTDMIIILASAVLLTLSILFARERTIFTDTAIYLFSVADSGHFYIATNRFICILSQVLPIAGVLAGLSLKTVMYLYSINCILIPLISIVVCIRAFKDRSTALAILLFYVIMSAWVFYYPVTEFQMGLCLLLVYHSFLLWYFKKAKQKLWLFLLMAFLFVITITFSHPLSVYVFFAWLIWLLINHQETRKYIMALPAVLAIASHFFKEHYMKAAVGTLLYDEQRKEGLKNFKAPVSTYFDSLLSKGALHSLVGDYFVMLIMAAIVLIYFAWKKKWITMIYFGGIVFAFWLLVTVSFRDWPYDHYPEHLYQPVPFFIALAFAGMLAAFSNQWIKTLSLLAIFVISIGKIYNNHKFFTERLAWYQRYIDLMQASGIRNATLSAEYTVYGVKDAYWASKCESLILSGLPSPDAARQLIINGDVKALNENWREGFLSGYFGKEVVPYVSLDTLFSKQVLDSLKKP